MNRLSTSSSRFEALREQAHSRFEAFRFGPFERYTVAALVVILYVVATALSGSRQLWYDELHTYYIAKAPTLSRLIWELRLDLNPPLEYLAVRASLWVLGDSSYAARVPSILSFFVGSLCFYRFVSKRLGRAYGLLAMLAVWATPFFAYATEARPYGLIMAWFGIAMLAWEETSKPGRSTISVLILAAAVAGMMLSHMFTLFYVSPFCVAESWRLYRTRRVDWAVWAALLVPTIIPFAFVRLITNLKATPFPPMFEASPRKLGAFYYHTLVPEAPALVLAVGVALLAGFGSKRYRADATARMNPVEIAFTAGLLAIPEIVMLALMASRGAFFPRYAILCSFGYALLLVFGIARLTGKSGPAAVAACCVLFLYDAGAIKSGYDVQRTQRAWPAKETAMSRVRPDLALVLASGFTFLEMGKYAAPDIAQRLYYLTSPDLAFRYAHTTMFQDFATRRHYFAMQGTIEPYRQFVAEHPQFLVFGTPGLIENWLLRWLSDVHAKMQFVGTFVGPYSDYQLFEVTMPGAKDLSSDR